VKTEFLSGKNLIPTRHLQAGGPGYLSLPSTLLKPRLAPVSYQTDASKLLHPTK
jgi:hypothetical protein